LLYSEAKKRAFSHFFFHFFKNAQKTLKKRSKKGMSGPAPAQDKRPAYAAIVQTPSSNPHSGFKPCGLEPLRNNSERLRNNSERLRNISERLRL
jgi:hypothetical protein